MSFKNQSVFSSVFTNTTFTITEEMQISEVSIEVVSGTATLLGGLQIPGLVNIPVSLDYNQPVVLKANKGFTLSDITVDSTAGGVFEIIGIYGYNDALDPAAVAFFAATGITGIREQQAINDLITSLRNNGLWSKMKAVYPFVTDNRNLLNYTEDFGNAVWVKQNSSVTTNSTTAPNGTLTADTLIENTSTTEHFTNTQLSKSASSITYTASLHFKNASGTRNLTIAITNGVSAGIGAVFSTSGAVVSSSLTIGSGAGFTAISASVQDAGNGWYRAIFTASSDTSTRLDFVTYLTNGTTTNYAGNGTSGIYIWGAQLEVGSPASTYQAITTTQQAYISNQFKFNLVNPVDSDAAFRLVFNGGWTHSSNGATPNGTNGYADTKFIPSSNFTSNNNISLGYYTRNFASGGITLTGEMGSANSGLGNGVYLIIYYNVTGQSVNRVASNTSQLFSISPIAGFYSLSRTTSANFKYFRNNILLDTPAITSSGRTSNSMWIGGVNYGTSAEYGQGQCAFSFIGDGLTDTEAANLYTAVQNYQTSLSRQV
jgi:hypothetical protein